MPIIHDAPQQRHTVTVDDLKKIIRRKRIESGLENQPERFPVEWALTAGSTAGGGQ